MQESTEGNMKNTAEQFAIKEYLILMAVISSVISDIVGDGKLASWRQAVH